MTAYEQLVQKMTTAVLEAAVQAEEDSPLVQLNVKEIAAVVRALAPTVRDWSAVPLWVKCPDTGDHQSHPWMLEVACPGRTEMRG